VGVRRDRYVITSRKPRRAVVAVVAVLTLIAGPLAFVGGASDTSDSAYVLSTSTGILSAFGNVDPPPVQPLGDTVDMVIVGGGKGVHLLSADATVRSAGTSWIPGAVDVSSWQPREVAVAMVMTPSENGAWIATSIGRVAALGDAQVIVDASSLALAEPIIDAASTGVGGLLLLGADGGIFSLGTAQFRGSVPQVLPGVALDAPLAAIVVTPSGLGYWLFAADGGLFAFGDARFAGSIPSVLPGVTLNKPVVEAVAYGDGYLMVASDGGVFSFSNLDFEGSLGANPPPDPIVAISPLRDQPSPVNSSGSSSTVAATTSSAVSGTPTSGSSSTTLAATTTTAATTSTTTPTTTTSSSTTTTTTTATTTTTTTPPAANASINIWHDSTPSFGQRGVPQRWVNVQGTVTDPQGILRVQYRLNGGPWTTMQLGPDVRRLTSPNSFNVDLAVADLRSGSNALTIRVTDNLAGITTETTTINWTPGVVAPANQTITWAGRSSPSAVAQPVDGRWRIVGPWLNNVDDGYDRIVAIGDQTWTDYEVTVPVVLNSIHPDADDHPSRGPGLGFALRWNGHNDTLMPGSQPQLGFLPDSVNPSPFGAVLFWRDSTRRPPGFEIYDEWNTFRAADDSFTMTPGTTYMFKAQVQGPGPTTYRFRVWRQGQPEPTTWNVQYTTPGRATEPSSGSIALIAHEVDANFGQVTVRPL